MSHNDYTKYAKESRVETLVVEPEIVETPVEENPVVEPEIVESESVVEEISHTMGRVIGCTRLNVRSAPKPRAEVLCEINCDTEVEVDMDNSTVDFYKICTASGIEGYCVKTYISVNSDK